MQGKNKYQEHERAVLLVAPGSPDAAGTVLGSEQLRYIVSYSAVLFSVDQ